MDLTKKAGDEITFDLINPMGGKPIMGSAMAEGRGRAMSLDQDRLRINQARYPISAGDTMTQQRTPHELRTLARSLGQAYMDRLADQLILTHLAGARGFHDNIEWAVAQGVRPGLRRDRHQPGEGADPQPALHVHRLRASRRSRHRATRSRWPPPTCSTPTWWTRCARSWTPCPCPAPVIFEGDKMATDARCACCCAPASSTPASSSRPTSRTYQANAARAQQVA